MPLTSLAPHPLGHSRVMSRQKVTTPFLTGSIYSNKQAKPILKADKEGVNCKNKWQKQRASMDIVFNDNVHLLSGGR